MSDKLGLGRQISPFDTHKADVAITLLMMNEAIGLLQDTYYQSPHFDTVPTEEQLDQERRWEEESEIAKREVNRLASEIYMSLTGKYPDRQQRYEPEVDDIPF